MAPARLLPVSAVALQTTLLGTSAVRIVRRACMAGAPRLRAPSHALRQVVRCVRDTVFAPPSMFNVNVTPIQHMGSGTALLVMNASTATVGSNVRRSAAAVHVNLATSAGSATS